ncbi:REP-associated tyrosine transposase [Uliginosibacterium gangwonense]|uniref:REP-associated tyrosine transposase n=1 Tax=Uliginosibacterium gangwonense TaxID=392736 RepID=UPI00037323E8|nr:transposase [Uliginosibacterium gangwonense]
MSRYRRATVPGASYFFTVVSFRRRPVLTDERVRAALRAAILITRKTHPFAIDAWVLLPDHLHCIWTLPEGDADFGVRWNLIKRLTSSALPPDLVPSQRSSS